MEIEYKNPFVDLESYEGETIEQKVERIVNNNEPITDSAPQLFTERKDGVQAAYNVRTDRWDIAMDAMDLVTKDHLAKREERIKERESDKPSLQTETEN